MRILEYKTLCVSYAKLGLRNFPVLSKNISFHRKIKKFVKNQFKASLIKTSL
ncbi:hypothetical protein [Campylobacter cuniculorum]|uniref:Uncharacterized protein n=1 Tax=Campylobacter cuniculorum TaxID=374106 RepID=A0ABX6TW15_9BACT|nr:hypothetical protein [Campylobacter cuniculorum]QOR03892.1 hypothetical protein A0071_06870 [Campylobacter cuniculorum]